MHCMQTICARNSAWIALCLLSLLAGGEAAQAQFVTGDEEKMLRAMIPLAEFRDDPAVKIYTERTMPRTYQFDSEGGVTGAFLANDNISGDEFEASKGDGNGGNICVDFPWKKTAGTARSPSSQSFKFMRLPDKPVVWFPTTLTDPIVYSGNQVLQVRKVTGYAWRFPVGTIFGEVLIQRHPNGFDYAYEVRTRERLYDRWTTDVFKPFPEPADLAKAISAGVPNWRDDAQLAKLMLHLQQPQQMRTMRLSSQHPVRKAFDSQAEVDVLPPINEDLAAALLTSTEFRSCHGMNWRGTCAAPTTAARFHVVPTNYDAGFVPADDQSCVRCHETTGMHVSLFERRDWYGWMNPGDRIISFHPFDPSCISTSGFHHPVKMRNIKNVIERYDPARHKEADYHALSR